MQHVGVLVAAIWICSGLFSHMSVQAQEKQPREASKETRAGALPGKNGPPWEYVGDGGVKISGACVSLEMCIPDKSATTPTFPSGTKSLNISFTFEREPGNKPVSLEVYDKNGKVELAAGGWFRLQDRASGRLTLSAFRSPKDGAFAGGPQQAKFKVDDKVVALVNWEIEASK